MLPRFVNPLLFATLSFNLGVSSSAVAQACYFAEDRIITVEPPEPGKSVAESFTPVVPTHPVSAVWGTLHDGRIVATLQKNHIADADAVEGHSHDAAAPLAAVSRSGSTDVLVTSDVLRAFVSPGGNAIAAITPARELLIWREGSAVILLVNTPGKVSHVAWSPDGARIAAAVYPPDFSPHAMDNPRSVEHFLHLQNSDLYLFDATTGALLSQLTSGGSTDYNPFFSPDGTQLFYVCLHATENAGGVMRLKLDRDNATSSSTDAVQLTHAGAEPSQVPVGRVGTYIFANGGASLIFESGRPDGSGEVWAMKPDGKAAAFVAEGRKPQRLSDGSISILTPHNTPRRLDAQEISR